MKGWIFNLEVWGNNRDIQGGSHKDLIAEGIWSQVPTKFSVNSKIRCHHLNTCVKQSGWGYKSRRPTSYVTLKMNLGATYSLASLTPDLYL